MPTAAQSLKAVILCQWLSNGFQPIHVFRSDNKYKTIYLQADTSEEIAFVIYADGKWEFV